MYPKYSVSCAQKADYVALIFSPALHNWMKQNMIVHILAAVGSNLIVQ